MTTEAMRAAFEASYSDGGDWPKGVARTSEGDYVLMHAEGSWRIWKAGVLAERERAAKVCEELAQISASPSTCAYVIRKGETP